LDHKDTRVLTKAMRAVQEILRQDAENRGKRFVVDVESDSSDEEEEEEEIPVSKKKASKPVEPAKPVKAEKADVMSMLLRRFSQPPAAPAASAAPEPVASVDEFAPPEAEAFNPAFDVTPARLIRGIITERGVIAPVTQAEVARVLGGD
jgi:methylthioribose-1-phosphate isomerase